MRSDPPSTSCAITNLTVGGITMKDFSNNGLFARGIDGFSFVDRHSIGNRNHGIFPVSSRNGIITRSSVSGSDDSGIWVEPSVAAQKGVGPPAAKWRTPSSPSSFEVSAGQ